MISFKEFFKNNKEKENKRKGKERRSGIPRDKQTRRKTDTKKDNLLASI